MSEAQRAPYNNQSSKTSKNTHVEPTKYTSFGESFDELDRKRDKAKQAIMQMELTIEEMLQTFLEQDSKKNLFKY
jgi:hypothetical protein